MIGQLPIPADEDGSLYAFGTLFLPSHHVSPHEATEQASRRWHVEVSLLGPLAAGTSTPPMGYVTELASVKLFGSATITSTIHNPRTASVPLLKLA